MTHLFENLHWNLLLGFTLAVIITLITIPSLVRAAFTKKLVSRPKKHSVHTGDIPAVGGVAIFAAIAISSSIFAGSGLGAEYQYILPAILIIFFIGLKDDLIKKNSFTKLGGQLIASIIIIVLADIRVSSLHGVFGINNIGIFMSLSVSLFLCLLITNAFNLLDGIDGLAGGLGIQVSVVFGIWMTLLKEYDYALLSFTLTGSLIVFVYFNVFGKKNKIFLGDSGSLILGFVFSILTIKIMSMEIHDASRLNFRALPVVVLSVMAMPLVDAVRIFFLRMVRGKSPFVAEKNHFHHYLVGLGMSHVSAALIIIIFNIGLAFLAFTLRNKSTLGLFLLISGLATGIIFIFRNLRISKHRKKNIRIRS